MSTKIAFFDIDGTLTSEVDGSLPDSAILAIRQARANGNLMFINTGRCYQNVEPRFMEIGLLCAAAEPISITAARSLCMYTSRMMW